MYILFETCVHEKIRNMYKHVTNPQLLTQSKHAPSKKKTQMGLNYLVTYSF